MAVRETSQTQKDKSCRIPHIWRTYRSQDHRDRKQGGRCQGLGKGKGGVRVYGGQNFCFARWKSSGEGTVLVAAQQCDYTSCRWTGHFKGVKMANAVLCAFCHNLRTSHPAQPLISTDGESGGAGRYGQTWSPEDFTVRITDFPPLPFPIIFWSSNIFSGFYDEKFPTGKQMRHVYWTPT